MDDAEAKIGVSHRAGSSKSGREYQRPECASRLLRRERDGDKCHYRTNLRDVVALKNIAALLPHG